MRSQWVGSVINKWDQLRWTRQAWKRENSKFELQNSFFEKSQKQSYGERTIYNLQLRCTSNNKKKRKKEYVSDYKTHIRYQWNEKEKNNFPSTSVNVIVVKKWELNSA